MVYTQLRQSQSQQITQIKFILTNVISQVIHSSQSLISPTILTALLIDQNSCNWQSDLPKWSLKHAQFINKFCFLNLDSKKVKFLLFQE